MRKCACVCVVCVCCVCVLCVCVLCVCVCVMGIYIYIYIYIIFGLAILPPHPAKLINIFLNNIIPGDEESGSRP